MLRAPRRPHDATDEAAQHLNRLGEVRVEPVHELADVRVRHGHHEMEMRRQARRDVDLDAESLREHGQQPDEERVERRVRPQQEPPPLGSAADGEGRSLDDSTRRSHAVVPSKARSGDAAQ